MRQAVVEAPELKPAVGVPAANLAAAKLEERAVATEVKQIWSTSSDGTARLSCPNVHLWQAATVAAALTSSYSTQSRRSVCLRSWAMPSKSLHRIVCGRGSKRPGARSRPWLPVLQRLQLPGSAHTVIGRVVSSRH